MTQALMTASFVLNVLILNVLLGQMLSTRSVELVGASSNSSDIFRSFTYYYVCERVYFFSPHSSYVLNSWMAACVREALM